MTVVPVPPVGSDLDELLSRFEHLARTSPARPAVLAGDRLLAAGDLDARSNRLARHLQSLGAGPGNFVGIDCGPGIGFMVALLAVVRSGAAYVPLDPSYPRELLACMIESAGVAQVLGRGTCAATFRSAGAVQVTDPLDPALDCLPADAPRARPAPEDPLHAIFTSCSTGEPIAAAVSRGTFSRLLDWYLPRLDLGSRDRVLVLGSPGSSLAQKSLFAALFGGASLILDEQACHDPARRLKLVRDQAPTLLAGAHALVHPLLEAAAPDGYAEFRALRLAVLGGDPVPLSALRPWLTHPACRAEVLATYGFAECGDLCTSLRLHRGNLDDIPPRALGREIPEVTVSIRDEDLAPVPDGEAGELCIGGSGLGGGYLGDPARSRRAFALAGGIFRSGDLARRLPGGTLEFLGRAGGPAQGRPVSIEDLEARLEQHPAVGRALARIHGGRLIAYVTPSDASGGLVTLRAHQWAQRHREALARSGGTRDGEALDEWTGTTVARLRRFGPRRVFEIGCGTGRILSRLAADVECYWASDFSKVAIDALLANPPAPNLRLCCRPADDFSGVPERYFDTVVIHSVAHCFPDTGYLARVLEGAARCLKPGGRIFLGDLRSRALLAARHAESLRHHAAAGTTCGQLREQLARRLAESTELALDPAWFDHAGIPGLSHIEIQLRRGIHCTAATTYHYDAILHVGEKPALQLVTKWRQWDRLNLEQLEAILAESKAEGVVAGIPDARLHSRLGFLRALEHSPEDGPLPFAPSPPSSALTAEQLHVVAEANGFRAHVRWRGNGSAGLLDVMFLPAGSGLLPLWPVQATPPPLAHEPHSEVSPAHFPATLRQHLAARWPNQPLPAEFVLLDEFPLTPDGRIDPAALPLPGHPPPPRDPAPPQSAGLPIRQADRTQPGQLSGIVHRD
jgi:acyl-CoA synthetase (AMP-forming)/AMP-acid ligase II/2-polyprenyl-3-methyl-5-hydroxy-6-metoxy-1,4-benzoquinol methylase